MAVKPFDVMNLGKVGLIKPEQVSYQDSIEIILDEFRKNRISFVKIGWHLKHINETKTYVTDGYKNIYEFARDRLKISQATASRFMNLCIKFSVNNDSPELDEKYIDFSVSQLYEMLPMNNEEKEQITPDMTVKQIREKKKESQMIAQGENDDIPGQTSIEKDFPEYMPEEQAEKQKEEKTESYATSHKRNVSCPPSASSCIRQEWGTTPEQQEAGKKECEKCWEHYDKLSPKEDMEKIIDGEYREIDEPKPEEEGKQCEESCNSRCGWIDEPYQSENDTSEHEEITQPELPILKNNDQRKEWLADYKAWGLWYRDEHIDVNYYKYDFSDGSRLIVAEYPQRQCYWKKNKIEDEHYYHMMKVNKEGYNFNYNEKYRNSTDSETELVDFLKNLQKKGQGG